MLLRAWLFLGVIAATLQMAAFFLVLTQAGWHPGAPTGPGSPLHHGYQQATAMPFPFIVWGADELRRYLLRRADRRRSRARHVQDPPRPLSKD
jgi:hypothetical protein